MLRRALIPTLLAMLAVPGAAMADPAALVSTTDGTLGPGFPMVGASLPFGLIQPGPDTALPSGQQDPVDYDGYSYQDPDIRGFSLTHFDGAGIQIAGDLPFLPTTGAVASPAADRAGDASPYEHATEVARPGYYAVTLARYGVRAELTGTLRAAMMRFTFPAGQQANVLADVTQGINGQHTGSVTITGDRTLTGWVRSDVGYRVYFQAQFDQPFTAAGTWSGSTLQPGSRSASGGGIGAYLTFAGSTVTMRVAISYTDPAGAAGNLAAELPAGRSFDAVRAAARAVWDRELARVAISGGTLPGRETFYDNLYRALLMPSVLDDADGQYLGMDGAVHAVQPGHHHYTALSLWDTYRSQLPLLELIEPRVAHDQLVSLLDDADQNHGVIPRWVQANIDRGIMAGDSGSAALADGAAAGLLGAADTRRALSDLVHQATALPPVWPREHLDSLLQYGYIPQDVDGIGTSLTEEYGIDDNAVASLARALGDSTDAAALTTRSGDWQHLVNPADHFIRPRNRDGSWPSPSTVEDPSGLTGVKSGVGLPYSPMLSGGYQEGTGWQYLWSVPQDVAGLAQAIGGRQVALRRLNRFFSAALDQPLVPAVAAEHQLSGFFGVYFIGNQYTSVNEPDLWAPWFYDWLGQPWQAQKVARAEMSAYNSTPEGLPGNDDTGEMSAWYVLAALGLYHTAPGVDAWELSSPAFQSAQVRVARHSLLISSPGASAAKPYVSSLSLDGAPVDRTFLTSCQLRTGRALSFGLAARPDRNWAAGAGAAPPSASAPVASVDACAARLAGGAGG